MRYLLPRLPGAACDEIVGKFLLNGPSGWAVFDPDHLPDQVRYAATGGMPVPGVFLASLRQDIVAIARRHGFEREGGRNAHADFDAETAALLAQSELFTSGEALRDDVWAFIAAVLAPDIVYWRFGSSAERYGGGVRNTFQRLWMRGRALDRGEGHPERWRLLSELTEDALVQITERPSIGGDCVLALAVAEAWLRAACHHGKTAMEDIMRRAILLIRVRNEIRSLADLDPGDLASFLDGVFGIQEKVPLSVNSTSDEYDPCGLPARNETIAEDQVGLSAVPTLGPPSQLADAADRIREEARRRGWLSRKSQSALENLRAGRTSLSRRERNALEYLLARLWEAGTCEIEGSRLKAALR